ncbi:hypothetical protein G3I15_21645, partial [Streptomyces sp. SID10244]|nr:hypothetical protein [Streptomyces sp. SID10244]
LPDTGTDPAIEIDIDLGDNALPDVSAPLDIEDIALELGARPSTDTVLRDELEEVVISLDPEGAAEAREGFAQAWQNVTVSNDSSGHANIDACV